MAQRSLDILRDWWRTQPNKIWPIVIIVVVATGVGIVVVGLIVIGAEIVQKWQAGTLLDDKLFKMPGFWILLGLIGAGIVLLLLFWVVVLLWAWITLPFTLQAGVLAVDRLRLEVEQLRRQMFPAAVDAPDDDFAPDDLDDDVGSS